MPFPGQIRVIGGVEHIFTIENGWVPTPQVGLGLGGGGGAGGDGGATGPTYPTVAGEVVAPDPNNYWSKPGAFSGAEPVKASPGEAGAWFEQAAYDDAVARYQQLTGTEPGGGPGGARGSTPEELAIERSRVATSNMANYIDAAARGLAQEIDAKRLTTEQAIGEFNRQLDAMTEARTGFLGAQQYTIPQGATEIHPDIRRDLGMEPWIPDPIEYDPFGMALELVRSTPEITGIGVPETDAVQRALELAAEFL